jgi:threonine/homoserine/homoserine lactone efflux protein
MPLNEFLIFALASLLLNLTPGNDMLYIISRSTGQGMKAGIVSAFGIMAGSLVHITAAVIGLSAILASSAIAFNLIKFIGAIYLIYLGLHALLSRKQVSFKKSELKGHAYNKIFMQGALTNILNPKVALFFLAFLPQFIDMHAPDKDEMILFLGIYFSVSGTIVNLGVAVLFGKLANFLSRSPGFLRMQEKITGVILLALGIRVALSTKTN